MSTLSQVNQLERDLSWGIRDDVLGDARAQPPLPVLPPLQPLIPGGELRAGSVVRFAALPLGLTLAAGPSREGAWCAVVGMPEAGIASAAGMGVAPDRLLLVDDPGRRWADVVAALTEGVRIVLIRPPVPPTPQVTRRLTALARRHGSVLAVDGPWAGAHLRLHIEESAWTGVSDGHGHLRGRRALVVASGRGAAGPGRRAWLWLPGPDGSVSTAEAPLPQISELPSMTAVG